ncbi:MAG: methyl-accepting chemotaxis protein [Rickettsiales bacterium]
MTIKHSLLVIILALNAIIAYFLVGDIGAAIHHKHQLHEEQEANIAMTDLLKAAGDWAVERGVSNAALNASAPISDERKQKILARREAAKAMYVDALKHIDELIKVIDPSNPHYQLLIDTTENTKQRFAEAEQLRALLDKNLEKYKSQRDPELIKQWVPTMSALIITSQDLRFLLTEEAMKVDPELGREGEFRHFSWIMSEYAGRERAMIGGLIAANQRITNVKLKTLSEYRGRVEEAWGLVKKLGYTSNEDVHKAMANVQKVFFDDFSTVRDRIYAAGMRNPTYTEEGGMHSVYPVSGEDWIASATKAINSILMLQEASFAETDAHMAHVEAEVRQEILFKGVFLVVSLIVSAAAFYVLFFKVLRPLRSMTDAMNILAGGDTKVEIPCVGQKNEMGEMADSVQVFKDNALERKALREKQRQTEERAKEEKRATMNGLADSFEQRVQGIIQTVASASTELSQTAEMMANTIEKSSKLVMESTAGAEQTSANVQSVASAAEEMSATVSEISSQIQKSNGFVEGSVNEVDGADTHAQALSAASTRVKDVISLISDIAGQINLLALNATIESARAGEAGKGFAVVAGEVKNLAGQTDTSIQEIEKVIAEINVASEDILNSLGGIKKSVSDISDASGGIAAAVEEQSATTNEIASNMQSAAQGTQTITGNLQGINQSTQESKEASEQVLAAAQELSRQSETLSREVEEFMSEIRAA